MAWSEDRPPVSIGAVALVVAIVIAGLVGLAVRLWFLGNAPINSDEATVGLMAHEILHGHNSAFYWGQDYGGVEPYVVASLMAVFGQSALTLTATPALLSLAGALLVWRIGIRLFPTMAAVCAAALTWVWSESSLWNSTRELGLHQVCLVLGLVAMLWSLRIIQRIRSSGVDRILDWAVFGGAIGLGFWASPEIVYFAVPSAIVAMLALRGRTVVEVLARVGVSAGIAVIGALPWLVATLKGGGSTFPASPVPYPSRLATFFSHVLPMTLGLRIEGAGAWEGSAAVGMVLYGVLLVALVSAVVIVALRTRDGLVLALTVVLFPFLYAAFPTSWFWNDGRYAIGVGPIVSLVLIGGLWQAARVPVARWVACLAIAAAVASTLVAFDAGYGTIAHPTTLTRWSANPQPGHHLARRTARSRQGRPCLCRVLGCQRSHVSLGWPGAREIAGRGPQPTGGGQRRDISLRMDLRRQRKPRPRSFPARIDERPQRPGGGRVRSDQLVGSAPHPLPPGNGRVLRCRRTRPTRVAPGARQPGSLMVGSPCRRPGQCSSPRSLPVRWRSSSVDTLIAKSDLRN